MQVRIIVCLLLLTMVVVVDTVSATPLRQLADGVDLATVFAICGAAVLVEIGITFTWDRQ